MSTGKIIGIAETVAGRPESGVYKVDPRTRKLMDPRQLQAFEVLDDGGLRPTNQPIEEIVRLTGGSVCR